MADSNKQTDWQQIARAHFHKYGVLHSCVSGVGQYALLLRCGAYPTVRLFATWALGAEAQALPCDSPNCQRSSHSFIKLQPPAPRVIRRAHWFREIEKPA